MNADNISIKILVVTSIHPDYDARVWRHAKSLADSGLEVHLICPWNVPAGSIVGGVHMLPFKPLGSRLARIFQLPYRIMPLVARMLRRVDIIHFHDIDTLPIMILFRFFRPVVYDVHENYPDEMLVRYWIPSVLRKPLYWIVKYVQYIGALVIRNIVLVVPAQEKDFPKKHIRKIIVRNYASMELLTRASSDYSRRENRVVFTGSQYPENGTLLLIDIMRCLEQSGHCVELICVDRFSDVKLREEFIKRIRESSLDRFVTITANVPPPEIMNILNMARIGVITNLRVPKQEKALPTRLFEYMAAGLPVVASDLPLIKYFVESAGCGLLARPEDPQSFATAILELLNNKEWAMTVGHSGRLAFVDRFSWESQMPALVGFYHQILQG